MKIHRTLLVLIGLTASAAFASAQAPEPPKTTAVPFIMLPSRHIVIEAKLNGKGPYKLIFDTGAPINLVSSKLAKEAGLTKGGGGGLMMLFAGPNQVEIGALKVGDATVEKVPAIVMDHPTVTAISNAFKDKVGPLEGIVGFPFFARYATTIDYQKKELLLTPNGFKPGNYLEDMIARLTAAAEHSSAPRVTSPAGLWGMTVEKAGDDEAGVTVKSVLAKGPAASGGLQAGDRLLTIDGRWTDSVSDTFLAASLVKPGRTVDVLVRRDGKEVRMSVTPANGL